MNDIIDSSESNRVLVIGNGFDLNLGWNTRFSDFANSEFWPRNSHRGSIIEHLNKYKSHCNWFDLEDQIGAYASSPSTIQRQSLKDINKQYYNNLVEGFKDYLNKEIQNNIDKESIAALILLEIGKNKNFKSIYSFNYTNLYDIAERLNIPVDFTYNHVHGAISDHSMIIGAPEEATLLNGYEFLYKTFNSNYKSSSLIYDLQEAKEVVFFGHSLGPTDYHYFRSFFKNQCREDMHRSEAKKITIFTYDDISRLSILNQLRSMNEKKTNLLYHHNDFKIIMTKDGLNNDVQDFVSHLRKSSLDKYRTRFDELLSVL